MFKLLIVTLAILALTAAHPAINGPDEENQIVPSKSTSTAAPSPQTQQPASSASSDDESSNEDEEALQVQVPPSAPAGVTRLTLSSSPLAATLSSSVQRALSSGGLVVTSSGSGSIQVPASVQHHVLPAEAIPLPITVSTRAGLRTVLAPETITIHQPTVAKIGEVVQRVPTAVSHQSQTIVHNHARVVTPIVAPAVRTITQQVLRAYHTPLVLVPQTPVVRVVNN